MKYLTAQKMKFSIKDIFRLTCHMTSQNHNNGLTGHMNLYVGASRDMSPL